MKERENFLARWSRRKQAAVQAAQEACAQEQGEESAPAQGLGVGTEEAGSHRPATPTQGGGERTEPAARSGTHSPNRAHSLDLSQLPAIESITADTDIRAFLAPGIPAHLTRAALRRV